MKKLGLALFLFFLGFAPAQAQIVTMPPPAGTVGILCVYNTSPPTLSTSNIGFVQCDSSGKLLGTATISGALPAGTNVIGYVSNDPCTQAAKTNLPISFQTTSITQLIALSGSTKIYVCSLSLIASAATVFSITGGTGSNCGTPAALIGSTSATHGLSLAANGGLTLGSGAGTVAVTGAGSELCIVQSGAGDLVGNLTYVQQ